MTAAHATPEGRASSLGARLYEAMAQASRDLVMGLNAKPFHELTDLNRSRYERAAVSFVASLTYAESEGVREALLSSLLLSALKPFAEAAEHLHPSTPDDGVTLDGIEVRHWRAAWAAVAAATPTA